jgi:predicted esterase
MTSLKLGLLLLLTFFPGSSDQIKKQKLESQGKQRNYYLFVPESASQAKNPALLVLFHGSGRNGLSLVEKWKDLASKEGFIIAGPDSSSSEGWRIPDDGPEFIHDLVEALIKQYRVDPHRLYMFGHSAGAVFGLNLAMMESEYFAGLAVHAGSWRSKEEYVNIDLARRKIPVKIIVGDSDNFFSLDSVRATESALKDRQFPIEVKIMKGHDHWYYDLAPEINEDAWSFLKQNTLAADPHHTQYNPNGISASASGSLHEINALRSEAKNLSVQVIALDTEIENKIRLKDKSAIVEITKKQIALLDECARLLRNAAAIAENASKLKLPSRQQEYFSLLAVANGKRADAIHLIRERSELSLSDADMSSIGAKRNELAERANTINEEALELEKKAAALMN